MSSCATIESAPPRAEKYERKLLRRLREYALLLIVFLVLHLTILCLGSVMFYYIEQCSDDINGTRTYSSEEGATPSLKLSHLCDLVLKTNVTSTDNRRKEEILQICSNSKEECVLNGKTFRRWFQYCFSISFTIGDSRNAIKPVTTRGKAISIFYTIPSLFITVITIVYEARTLYVFIKYTLLAINRKLLKQKFENIVANIHSHVLCVHVLLLVMTWMSLAALHTSNCTKNNMNFRDAAFHSFDLILTIGYNELYYNNIDCPSLDILGLLLFYFAIGHLVAVVSGVKSIFDANKFHLCCWGFVSNHSQKYKVNCPGCMAMEEEMASRRATVESKA